MSPAATSNTHTFGHLGVKEEGMVDAAEATKDAEEVIKDADERTKDVAVATKVVHVVEAIRVVGVHSATRPLRRRRAHEEDMEADNNNSSSSQIVPRPRRSKRFLASIAGGLSANQRTVTTDPVDQGDLLAKPLAVRASPATPRLEEELFRRTWTAKQRT